MSARLAMCKCCLQSSPRVSSYAKTLHNGRRFLSRSTGASAPATKKYQETLLLPKTEFPLRIPAAKRKEHELELVKKLDLNQLYNLQKSWRRDKPEFILHDGPPYANGDPHIGHAVNKIMKDITNRYKLLRGYRINYTPGWDCHGLPIELKTMKEQLTKLSHRATPTDIREAARKVARDSIEKQKSVFQRWNIMADWNNPYHTYDKQYIQAQLRLFYSLYEKGYIYRCLKPIFWSPSSQSALAEAELEYKANHESLAVYLGVSLGLNLKDFSTAVGCSLKEDANTSGSLMQPVEAIIWTTTPWSLPANKAICFNEREKYSVVFKPNTHPEKRTCYVIASDQVPLVASTLKVDFRVVSEFTGSKLSNLTYDHPWFRDVKCPFLHGDHVLMDKGTGLVHTAPAHGNDDYVIGLKHNLAIDCFINDEGNFDSRLDKLSGLSATTAGNAAIVKRLESQIIHSEKYTHSYPYDWRTKKPVIVKTSMQWFIDTEKLKTLASTALKEVGIFPKNVQNTMLNQIMTRPFWCISRQRVWGVPIPVLYDETTGEPLVSKEVIEKVCEMVEKTGNIDWWWTNPASELLGVDHAKGNYVKGKDIFDIWFDSGVSWHTLNDKVADLYLEGYDQFTGWFQTSLLTSLAARGISPYKNLFVHGFVVDGENRKMSKSVGNVIDPMEITDGKGDSSKALGVDPLRWWVATQGSADGDNINLSTSFLRSSEESVQKLRAVLRFLVSFVQEDSIEALDIDDMVYEELMYTDQYMLGLLNEFQKSVTAEYDDFRYHRAITKALHFATTEVSSLYFTWVKDRLYCDLEESESRKSAIFVLNQLYLTLVKVLAPALPFLAEESFMHYSSVNESVFKYPWFNEEKTWENPNVKSMVDLALDVRASLNQIIGENNRKQIWVEIICNQKNFKTLQVLHPDKCTSELCDILQVSGVDLQCNDQTTFQITPFGVSHSLNGFSVGVSKTELMQCARCRRFCCQLEVGICSRCQSVLKRAEPKEHAREVQAAAAAAGEEVAERGTAGGRT